MINQKNREELIKLLDNASEEVKLEDLFLFDLSPYYREKENESFFSKQIEFIQEKNRLNHDSNISFTLEQISVYQGLVRNERNIVSAPTSFGKTMLIKEYIFNFTPEKVVFVVPTNSLADELLDDFKILFEPLGYIIFDSIKKLDSIPEKSIFIGTQEKYYNLIGFYDKINLFVIDEAYKLTDPVKGSREVILNRSFIDTLESSNKIILLMPLVNSISGLEQLNFEILKSDYAPVAKSFHSVKNLNKKILEHIKESNKTNLIYFSSPAYLEKFYLKNLIELKTDIQLSDQWINRVKEDFHPEWLPIRALNSGIGIHYGPMPKFIQKKVIELFKKQVIHNILATSSIIEGVNTPTKSIFIANAKDVLGKNDLVKFKNLIGRAGRLGEHKVGEIYYKESDQIKFKSANVPFEEINIQFVINKRTEVLEINREEDFYKEQDRENENTNEQNDTLKSILEDSNYKNVSQIEVSKLLNTHGFTLNQLSILMEYLKNDRIYLIGIIGKVYRSSIDSKAYNIALNHKYKTFQSMVEALCVQKPDENISRNISSLIEMIYSVLPFKIIPLLNFTLDLNNLYQKHNDKALISDKITTEALKKKAQFYSKFIGVDKPTHESIVIVNKLFEFGIPYQRVKPFINEIEEKLPNNFSIHDIKKIIFESDSMNDLRIYFE